MNLIDGINTKNALSSREPLQIAIRELTDSGRWGQLVTLAGTEEHALNALSGRYTGPLFLAAAIVNRTLGAADVMAILRKAETLCANIVHDFDNRRQQDLRLSGYTSASPGKAVTISVDLPLEFDFASGIVRSGNLQFNGVTARVASDAASQSAKGREESAVAESDLVAFCERNVEGQSSVPSMDRLWAEAQTNFPGKHVSRQRIRDWHRQRIPALSRKPGPRN